MSRAIERSCGARCFFNEIFNLIHPDKLSILETYIKLNPSAVNYIYKHLTPLFDAVSTNNFELVQLLLNYDADVNLAPKCITPLMNAIRLSNYEIIMILLDRGADVNAKIGRGYILAEWLFHPYSFAQQYNK